MKRTMLLITCLTVLALTSVGCGKVTLNLDGLAPGGGGGGGIIRFAKGAEFVAASQRGDRTASGYMVDSSMGSVYSSLEAQTPGGYRVYTSVEGHIISEEKLTR